jgi:hypothetical protein
MLTTKQKRDTPLNITRNPTGIRAPLFSFGGADRDRTGGLLVANQALSQLSYSPILAFSYQPSALSKIAFADG